MLVLLGALLLAVETINTSIEMLCDYIQPLRDPKIGKIKDVAAGATAVTEIGAGIVVAVLLWPHLLAWLHRCMQSFLRLLVRGQPKRFGKRLSRNAQNK